MTPDFDYLADLTLDPTTGIYNLFISTYNGNSVSVDFFRVTRSEEMRMDKVSKKLYGTSKYVGTLCQLNDVLNPYAIREGDLLAYCSPEQANNLMKVSDAIAQNGIGELLSTTRRDLLDSYKKSQQDPNRRNYLTKRDEAAQLPPTVMPNTVPQIIIENNKIKVSTGTFAGSGTTNPADLFLGAGWGQDPLLDAGSNGAVFVLGAAGASGITGLYDGSGKGVGGSGYGEIGTFNTGKNSGDFGGFGGNADATVGTGGSGGSGNSVNDGTSNGANGSGSGFGGANGLGGGAGADAGSGNGNGSGVGATGGFPGGDPTDYERILIRRYIKKITP